MIAPEPPTSESDSQNLASTSNTETPAPQPQSQYWAPPPPYPALCGLKARERDVTHNLMSSFVAMSASAQPARSGEDGAGAGVPVAEQFGKVMDMDEFLLWISGGVHA